jgi:hypothetical protein
MAVLSVCITVSTFAKKSPLDYYCDTQSIKLYVQNFQLHSVHIQWNRNFKYPPTAVMCLRGSMAGLSAETVNGDAIWIFKGHSTREGKHPSRATKGTWEM